MQAQMASGRGAGWPLEVWVCPTASSSETPAVLYRVSIPGDLQQGSRGVAQKGLWG